jgi:hypothetical protein
VVASSNANGDADAEFRRRPGEARHTSDQVGVNGKIGLLDTRRPATISRIPVEDVA